MKASEIRMREFAELCVQTFLGDVANPANEHARPALASYTNGVLDSAMRVGAICQSELFAAHQAMRGEELSLGMDYWW